MRQISPVLASLAGVFKIPITRPHAHFTSPLSSPQSSVLLSSSSSRVCAQPQTSAFSRQFSAGPSLSARKGKNVVDKRVTLIRYFLYHPLTPRPLRFSRNRYLRHWTIHRAWQLYCAKKREALHLELERQWNSMRDACEELRTGVGDEGRLFRISMNKKGVFTDQIPIEYGRMQTEGPSKEGWNYDWKR
ncbi:uncharacterized protein PADG_00555 [Paracoccidioides brasiliensis Pb18]|uniref:Ribosomal protein L28/L40, mitochondrial n=1 Tax=Paracoccidioides brasiliensis (strain Pb18) TaxID=502780 RepID=C1G115_PARBD|nr:uncharacterized protein PADG_00555 [Paracoccidioides brasiliensis Pb18]EEH44266.1 hypothetical protein PADG_00555 [Paracoccidioides brasiliensis Pb18]